MNTFSKITLLFAFALVSSIDAGQADSEKPANVEKSVERRDPFRTSGRMRSEAQKAGDGPRFLPGGGSVIPSIRLSGYAEVEGRAPLALIEIERHGTYVVRENDVISLQGAGNNVLKVIRVTNLTVSVEVGSLGHVIVVR